MLDLKAQPHSVQAEQAILGAILSDNGVIAEIGSRITAAMFYKREHKAVYLACEQLCHDRKPVDGVTLCEALSATGSLSDAGGIEYIAELASQPSTRNALHYAEIVRGKYLERRLIQAANKIAQMGYEGEEPVEQRLAAAQSELLAIVDSAPDGEAVHINQAMRAAAAGIEARHQRGGKMAGISSGFKDLDRMTGGWKPGEMILVAGRPSMGKSTLAQNFIEHAALEGKHVLFFSVEMPQEMVATRHLSSVGRVPLENLINANIKELGDGMVIAGSKLKDRFYSIDDTPSLISSQILLRAQRLQMKVGRPLDLIVVDYIQKLRDPGDNQNVRIQEISGNIKHAARVLNCPIVALSQLSRECEKRQDKRPMLSDLRDSGSLEQDADIVMFIYRDEVYTQTTEMIGIAEVLVRKNRNGQTGDCYLTSRLDIARFENFTGLIPTKQRGGKRGLE